MVQGTLKLKPIFAVDSRLEHSLNNTVRTNFTSFFAFSASSALNCFVSYYSFKKRNIKDKKKNFFVFGEV